MNGKGGKHLIFTETELHPSQFFLLRIVFFFFFFLIRLVLGSQQNGKEGFTLCPHRPHPHTRSTPGRGLSTTADEPARPLSLSPGGRGWHEGSLSVADVLWVWTNVHDVDPPSQ